MITKEIQDKIAALKEESVARIAGIKADFAARKAANIARREAVSESINTDTKIELIDKEIAMLQARKVALIAKKEESENKLPKEAEAPAIEE